MDELTTEEKNEIMQLIYTDHEPGPYNPLHLRPVAITRVDQTRFFPWHNNTYEGYFIDVQYASGLYEVWFVVDVSGGLSDVRWFLERIR